MPKIHFPLITPDLDTRIMCAYYRCVKSLRGVLLSELIIVLIIGRNGGSARVKQIAHALGITNDTTVWQRVRRMIKKGLLVKPSNGHYCLSDRGASVYSTATGFLQPVLDEIRADVINSLRK